MMDPDRFVPPGACDTMHGPPPPGATTVRLGTVTESPTLPIAAPAFGSHQTTDGLRRSPFKNTMWHRFPVGGVKLPIVLDDSGHPDTDGNPVFASVGLASTVDPVDDTIVYSYRPGYPTTARISAWTSRRKLCQSRSSGVKSDIECPRGHHEHPQLAGVVDYEPGVTDGLRRGDRGAVEQVSW